MALWPFRRRSGRKRSRSGAALSDLEGPPPRSQTGSDMPQSASATAAAARTGSQKKQRIEQPPPHQPTKLHRRARTYSFSPGRNDSIRVDGQPRSGQHGQTRLDKSPNGQRDAQTQDQNGTENNQWHRAPTLHKSRHSQLGRRKSSKRRRAELDREAEIKAMSSFTPLRPAAESWTAGRPMKKDSKRVKTGIGSAGRGWGPTSDVSLPIPESIHSTMSSDSEHASYKVSALEALAPRPTLRYAVFPRWAQPSSASGPARTPSQRRKLTDGAVPEATLKAHKRIDSLADDLDASDLRELMERDTRRREKKRQREQERIERRLTRRAEKQREAEAEARETGTPPPPNLERGVLGREVVGLGIDTTSAVVTSSRRRSRSFSPAQPGAEQATRDGQVPSGDGDVESRPQAVQTFHRTTSIPLDNASIPTVHEDGHAPATPPPEGRSPRSRTSFLRSIKSKSKSSLAVSEGKQSFSYMPSKSEESESAGKPAEPGSSRPKRAFSSLLRWGTRRSRRRSGPSSFSNASREEMQAAAAQAHAHNLAQRMESASSTQAEALDVSRLDPDTLPKSIPFTSRSLSSGVPKRTRSRFREDLPELPISPPMSPVAAATRAEPVPLAAVTESKSGEMTETRYDTPTSGHRTIDETMRQTPTSANQSTAQHSPQPHSVSLASIDSEASWLAGRIGKRSPPGTGIRDGMSRHPYYQQRHSHHSTSGNTEDELVEDEYLSKLATPPEVEMMGGKNSHFRPSGGEGRPSSDEDERMDESMEEDVDMRWGEVDTRQPVVSDQRRVETVRSQEGLLNAFNDDTHSTSSSAEAGGETPHLERATSVHFGQKGHVRHMSAGSAKLLDLTPRASLDSRGRSVASEKGNGSGPLFI